MTIAHRSTVALLLTLAACSSGSGTPTPPGDPGAGPVGGPEPPTPDVPDGEPAPFGVQLTDAPFEHALLDSVVLRFDKVTAHVTDGDDGGFLTLYEGAPIEIDLAPLKNGLTAPLVVTELPSGTWRQMRLFVESGELTLVNGNVYTTEDGSLQLPSASSSGLKVFFDPPIEVIAGAQNEVLIDFDLSNSFHPIPGNDPENAMRYQMHPVLRSGDCVTGGKLIGGVFEDAGGSPGAPFEGATVFVLPKGQTDTAFSAATTATDEDGSWAVICLAIGEYDVKAKHGDFESAIQTVTVATGQTTVVDLLLD